MAETGIGSSPLPQNSAACRSAFAAFSHLFTASTTIRRRGRLQNAHLVGLRFQSVCLAASSHVCEHSHVVAAHRRPVYQCDRCLVVSQADEAATHSHAGFLTRLVGVGAPQPGLDLLVHRRAARLQGSEGGIQVCECAAKLCSLCGPSHTAQPNLGHHACTKPTRSHLTIHHQNQRIRFLHSRSRLSLDCGGQPRGADAAAGRLLCAFRGASQGRTV